MLLRGGVGHYAIQIASYLGAYVIGISSAANRDFVLGLGAREHIDYKNQQIGDAVKEVDVVLDGMGGDSVESFGSVVKKGGTILTLPSGGADLSEKANALGISWHFHSVTSNGKDQQAIAGLLESGHLKSFVSKTYSLAEIREAHLQIETGKTKGKIIVIP